MGATVLNLDEQAYTALRARAVLEGRTVDELIADAVRAYLARLPSSQKMGTLQALKPEPFPEGNERLSLEIDAVVYGRRQ